MWLIARLLGPTLKPWETSPSAPLPRAALQLVSAIFVRKGRKWTMFMAASNPPLMATWDAGVFSEKHFRATGSVMRKSTVLALLR